MTATMNSDAFVVMRSLGSSVEKEDKEGEAGHLVQVLKKQKKTSLRTLGFSGVDDSVNPKMLSILSHSYPVVEFGVLFGADKEGQPRHASKAWTEQLKIVARANPQMKLVAHLCGCRVNELLRGDNSFLSTLRWCNRIQINASSEHGVDMSCLKKMAIENTVKVFATLANNHPEFEFIIPQKEETRPLWEGLLELYAEEAETSEILPQNVSMLVDVAQETSVLKSTSAWPRPHERYETGYSGGIGPSNVETVLRSVIEAGNGRSIWISMESSVRSEKNGEDIFDLDKCFLAIEAACQYGLTSHPPFLG